jgi:hypothetical protein
VKQERKNKMFEELKEELQLSDEVIEKLNGVANKAIQSESDKVRTEYSKKVKELEQYKPKEKSAEQIELEQLKSELANTKFQKSLNDIGVSNDMAKYLKSDIDIDEFKTFYEGFNKTNQDYVAKNHAKDTGMSKEQFKALSYGEKAKLYTENPSLYAQLKK